MTEGLMFHYGSCFLLLISAVAVSLFLTYIVCSNWKPFQYFVDKQNEIKHKSVVVSCKQQNTNLNKPIEIVNNKNKFKFIFKN